MIHEFTRLCADNAGARRFITFTEDSNVEIACLITGRRGRSGSSLKIRGREVHGKHQRSLPHFRIYGGGNPIFHAVMALTGNSSENHR